MKKIYKCHTLILIFSLCFLLTACGNDSESRSDKSGIVSQEMMNETKNAQNTDTTEASATDTSQSSTAQETAMEHTEQNAKKIYTASMYLDTTSFTKVYGNIHTLVKKYDGYFESDNTGKNTSYLDNQKAFSYADMTIRVPVDNFEKLLSDIGDAKQLVVTNKNVSVKDISENYYDTQNRIENYEAKLDQLRDLLKKTSNVKEMLEIENAMNDTEYQLEALKGQLKYYDSQIAYSTINVQLNEVTVLSLSTKATSYGNKLVEGFKSGFTDGIRFLSSLLLLIVSHWLIFLLILGILLVIYKKRKKCRLLKKNHKKELSSSLERSEALQKSPSEKKKTSDDKLPPEK